MKTKNIYWTIFGAAILYLFAQAVYASEPLSKPLEIKQVSDTLIFRKATKTSRHLDFRSKKIPEENS